MYIYVYTFMYIYMYSVSHYQRGIVAFPGTYT